MRKRYDEEGEIMEFVGAEETQVRGKLLTDGMGREWISANGNGGRLPAFLPEDVDMESVNDDGGSAGEYRFEITVEVDKPTGNFRSDEPCGVNPVPAWSEHIPTNKPDGRPDTQIVPYVDSLRSQGVETHQSCAGHEGADGLLWFDCPDFDVEYIASHGRFGFVRRMYSPGECWAVMFHGMSKGEESFEKDMEVLFDAIGAELP